MKYVVEIEGRTVEIGIDGHPSGPEIRLPDRRSHPEAEQVSPGEYRVALPAETARAAAREEGRAFHLTVSQAKPGHFIIEYRGRRIEAQVQEAFRAKLRTGPAKAAGGGTVRSDIPGLVSKVAVQEGQSVQPGDLLIVIEAMKMENEIRAKTAGTVAKLFCQPRQAILSGAPLVEIAPA